MIVECRIDYLLKLIVKKLTLEQKAVMIELSRKGWSPTYHYRWRNTSYDVIGLEFNPWSGAWTLNFKFRNYRQYNTGLQTPWDLTATTLAEIYMNYVYLEDLTRVRHELSYDNFHK